LKSEGTTVLLDGAVDVRSAAVLTEELGLVRRVKLAVFCHVLDSQRFLSTLPAHAPHSRKEEPAHGAGLITLEGLSL
jgi:hypothetical protein